MLELIEKITLTVDTYDIIFTGIPQDGKDLRLIANHQSVNNIITMLIYPNNSASLVTRTFHYSPSSDFQRTDAYSGTVQYASYGFMDCEFLSYADGATRTPIMVRTGTTQGSNSIASGGRAAFGSINPTGANTITSLQLRPQSGNFTAGSTFSLYKTI